MRPKNPVTVKILHDAETGCYRLDLEDREYVLVPDGQPAPPVLTFAEMKCGSIPLWVVIKVAQLAFSEGAYVCHQDMAKVTLAAVEGAFDLAKRNTWKTDEKES